MSQYFARQAVNAFFLAPTERLSRLLPPGLTPLEARPRHGVLAITSFDFSRSEVGPYAEVALSVIVSPYAPKDEPVPHAASYPFVLVTSTPESAEDAEQRWGLPRHPRSMDVRFRRDTTRYEVALLDQGAPVLTLSVQRGAPEPGTRIYQLFTRKGAQTHRVGLQIEGPFEQRDDEGGWIRLHDHPIAETIAGLLADDTPILEQSMEDGVQTFGTPVPWQAHR